MVLIDFSAYYVYLKIILNVITEHCELSNVPPQYVLLIDETYVMVQFLPCGSDGVKITLPTSHYHKISSHIIIHLCIFTFVLIVFFL